ncbi:ribonuclease H-like domain-containing protein [Tanacetum coccineum]
MCCQPLPPPLSSPSVKLMIIALEEYGYQSAKREYGYGRIDGVASNDNSIISIVNFKLIDAENYIMRATAMKTALKGKNKMGLINGTWWILESLSLELYVGQVYSKIASKVWTELKEAYDKIDGCYELIGYPAGFKRNPNLSKQFGNTKRFNANSEFYQSAPSNSGSLSAFFTI